MSGIGDFSFIAVAVGGGVGTMIGSFFGPLEAASFASMGAYFGAVFGGLADGGDPVTVMAGATGSYFGGLVGGFVGGFGINVSYAVIVGVTSTAGGILGMAVGRTAHGVPGAVVGSIAGAVVGSHLPGEIIIPQAEFMVVGIVGGLGAVLGLYFGVLALSANN